MIWPCRACQGHGSMMSLAVIRKAPLCMEKESSESVHVSRCLLGLFQSCEALDDLCPIAG